MRPSLHGLEMHLALIHKAIRDFQPQGIVIDPISNFLAAGGTFGPRDLGSARDLGLPVRRRFEGDRRLGAGDGDSLRAHVL